MDPYRYIESGLEDLYVQGLVLEDDADTQCIVIPNMGELHHCIADGLIQKEHKLNAQEIYFLRSELALSISSLKTVLGMESTASNDPVQLLFDDAHEWAFRRLVAQQLLGQTDFVDTKQLTAKETAIQINIQKDAQDHYQLLSAA